MATPLILTSPAIMSDPSDAPLFSDLSLGLAASFRPSVHLAGLADGDAVTNIVLDGEAPLRDRTYDRRTSGWDAPTMDGDGFNGAPALRFGGNAQIGNVLQGQQSVAVPVAQPITRCMVVKLDAYVASTTTKGFVRAASASSLQTIRVGPSGGLILDFGSSTVPGITIPLGQWTSLIVVANGASSTVKLGSAGPVSVGNIGAHAYAGEIWGGNAQANGAPADPFPFSYGPVDRYHRALSADEQEMWVAQYLG